MKTKTPKKYELTEEHRAQLKPWATRWIANAMRTGPYSEEEKDKIRTAVLGLYQAADLPPPKNIVFAAGPVTGALAACIAAGVWHLRKNPGLCSTRAATSAATDAATYDATDAATYDATHAATSAATLAATNAATHAATSAATHAATHAATRAATSAATHAATRAATRAATHAATRAATRAATDAATDAATLAEQKELTRFLLLCCGNWENLRNGGNQWSGWISFLSFLRHVAKLPIDYSKWQHYEDAALAGPRYMTPDFCIISALPSILRIDEQSRAHCEDGPSHAWPDGIELYYWHGTRVPGHWIMNRATVPVSEILAERNADVRTAGLQIVGWTRVLADVSAQVVDDDPDASIGTLYRVNLPDEPDQRILKARCGTGRNIALRVPPTCKTALEASAWTYGLEANEYAPEVRT